MKLKRERLSTLKRFKKFGLKIIKKKIVLKIKQGDNSKELSIEELREKSRRDYLKMREGQMLDELDSHINDEEYLFGGIFIVT